MLSTIISTQCKPTADIIARRLSLIRIVLVTIHFSSIRAMFRLSEELLVAILVVVVVASK